MCDTAATAAARRSVRRTFRAYRPSRAVRRRIEAQLENDPAEIARLAQEARECKEHANRWVDNLFQVKSYLIKKCSMDSKGVDAFFKQEGIGGDLDYIED